MATSIENVIFFQIERTNKMARQKAQKEFDRLGLGITVDQWVLLKILDEEPDISQNELADFSSRDPASITRTLDLLEKKELVNRIAISDNRRQHSIGLTSAGKKFVKENMKLVRDLRRKGIKGFSAEELENLSAMLRRTKKNVV